MNRRIFIAVLTVVIAFSGHFFISNREKVQVSFFRGLAAPTCDATTSCTATTTENGVTKWCRNINGDGHKWMVGQNCETGPACGGPNPSCQVNPVGIAAECAGKKLVCNNGRWTPGPVCGDKLCTPEFGENAVTCASDCPGVVDQVIDTKDYWPVRPGNFWVLDGVVTASRAPATTYANQVSARAGDKFSAAFFIESKETICGTEYYPMAFYKDKTNGYWQFGSNRILRWFVTDYITKPGWTDSYRSAPLSKLYTRNPSDPYGTSTYESAHYQISVEPDLYPAYMVLPRNVRVNKTWFRRQNSYITPLNFSTCEWLTPQSPPAGGAFIAGQLWQMQFALENLVTPAYTGEVLRVRFREGPATGELTAMEDWYFAKNIGVVRIHRYFDWKDPGGSTYFDMRLRSHGNSSVPPDFIPEQPAKRGWTSICGTTRAGYMNRTDAYCTSGTGWAKGRSWTSSCTVNGVDNAWTENQHRPVTSCIYALTPSSYTLSARSNQSWSLLATEKYTGWIDVFMVSGPVGNSMYRPAEARMENGSVSMPAHGQAGTYIFRIRPADDSATWSGEVKLTVTK